MEFSILIEYSWILLILIVLEGLLATDNALVLAIMVKHLPEEQRKRALFYGLAGAFHFPIWIIIYDIFSCGYLAGSSDWSDLSSVYVLQ